MFVRLSPGWKLVTAVNRADPHTGLQLPQQGMSDDPELVHPPPITLPDLHMYGPEPISALFGLATTS